jgi:hypothetical protein
MKKFLEIKSLDEKEQKRLYDKIEKILAAKKKKRVFSEREIKKIENMKLNPLLDIQVVQSVYEPLMFSIKKIKNSRDSND